MKIEDKLKEYNISIVKLAKILDVSRPTVYKVLEQYKDGKKIQNEKHKFILDYIENSKLVKDQFFINLKNYSELIRKEKTIGSSDLDIEKSNLLLALVNAANEDMHQNDVELDIHRFLVLLMKSYRKEECFKDITRYFLIFNGIIEMDNLDDKDKKLYSHLFKVFYLYKSNNLNTDEEYLNLFYSKMDERRKALEKSFEKTEKTVKERIIKDIEDKIKEDIAKEIKMQIDMGIKPEEINIEEIKKNIKIE